MRRLFSSLNRNESATQLAHPHVTYSFFGRFNTGAYISMNKISLLRDCAFIPLFICTRKPVKPFLHFVVCFQWTKRTFQPLGILIYSQAVHSYFKQLCKCFSTLISMLSGENQRKLSLKSRVSFDTCLVNYQQK